MLIGRKSLCAQLAAAAILVSGITAAQASSAAQSSPVATITINNNWQHPADYKSSLSSCSATNVNPPFVSIPQGQTGTYSASWAGGTSFGCGVYYEDDTTLKDCHFVVSRLINQTCNPATGVCTKTWAYPQVNTTGSTATCNSTFTSVSDTGAVVTSTNGNFSVTLTLAP